MARQQSEMGAGIAAPFDELVAQCEAFNFHDADPTSRVKVANAMQMVAQEITRRYRAVSELRNELTAKLANVECLEQTLKAAAFLPPEDQLTINTQALTKRDRWFPTFGGK